MEPKEYHVESKKESLVIILAIIAAIIIITLALVIDYWWIGTSLALLVGYWYFYEFYPVTPVKRAERIIELGQIDQIKREAIPCPTYFIRIMAKKNRTLRRRNQTYRWFLTTSPKPFKNKNIKVIKIEGKNCWFFTQDC